MSILNTCQKDNIPVKEKPSLTILEMVLKLLLMVFPDIVMLKTQLSQLKTLPLVLVQMITSVGNSNSISMKLNQLPIDSNSVPISVKEVPSLLMELILSLELMIYGGLVTGLPVMSLLLTKLSPPDYITLPFMVMKDVVMVL